MTARATMKVARVWRLGRQTACPLNGDPCETEIEGTRQGTRSIPGAWVPHARHGTPQRLIGLGFPYAGRRQPMECRLAWLTRRPPVTRRALVVRWTKAFHFHLLLGSEWQ